MICLRPVQLSKSSYELVILWSKWEGAFNHLLCLLSDRRGIVPATHACSLSSRLTVRKEITAPLLYNEDDHSHIIHNMAYSSRTLPSHLRKSTAGNSYGSSNGRSPALVARINEKKQELEDLKQLRDLSAGLAGQMSVLEEKLATLSDGTEGTHSSQWRYSIG